MSSELHAPLPATQDRLHVRTARRWGVALLGVLLVAVALPAPARPGRPPGSGDTAEVVLLHVNDTHGTLQPRPGADGLAVGGLGHLAAVLDSIRRAEPRPVLLLHAGDLFSRGDPACTFTGGEVEIRAMNLLGYDALVPGNGDFYFGIDNLLHQASLAAFPLIAANLDWREGAATVFPPILLRQVGPVRVGIIGLTFLRQDHPSAAPLAWRDPLAAAERWAAELRPRVDLLVALTHVGVAEDTMLARAVPALDLIVGGHSHTVLAEPLRVPRPGGGGDVVVVQAGDRGRFVGRVEVRLARMGAGWRVAAIDAGLVPVRATTREHPGVARLLAAAAAPLGVPVAWADTAVTHVRSGHTPMGSLAAAAVLAAAGAQVALLDRGAIQDGLEAGPITRADLLRVHPWRNRVVRALLTGAQLRAALAEADLVCAGEACAAAQDSTGAQDHGDPAAATDHQYVVAMGEYARAIAPSLKHIGVENTGLRVDTALELYLATSIRAGVPIPR